MTTGARVNCTSIMALMFRTSDPMTTGQEKVALFKAREQLAACRYFRIERLRSPGAIAIGGGLPHYLLLVSTRGSGSIAGSAYSAGQTWMVPAQAQEFI